MAAGSPMRLAMLRVLGGPRDPATRIESRIGEPAANPYLYFASQIHAGMDGMAKETALPPMSERPYEEQAPFLPRTLEEAIGQLKASRLMRERLGAAFVDYYCRIKEAEIARFNLEVSEWEHREYFELY